MMEMKSGDTVATSDKSDEINKGIGDGPASCDQQYESTVELTHKDTQHTPTKTIGETTSTKTTAGTIADSLIHPTAEQSVPTAACSKTTSDEQNACTNLTKSDSLSSGDNCSSNSSERPGLATEQTIATNNVELIDLADDNNGKTNDSFGLSSEKNCKTNIDDFSPEHNETTNSEEPLGSFDKHTRTSDTSDSVSDSVSDSEGEHCELSEEEEKKLHHQVRIIFFVLNIMGFLASFSYWMQSGVLPYLTRKLGVYSEVFGYMQSTYAFYQMIGSPIFGRCGDVFGCRCVMVVSELSAMLTYGMLSFASNVFMLFLSRVPALSQHNLQGSYMIITDISLPEQRAKMLGILGVSHGMGKLS